MLSRIEFLQYRLLWKCDEFHIPKYIRYRVTLSIVDCLMYVNIHRISFPGSQFARLDGAYRAVLSKAVSTYPLGKMQ